MARCVRCNSCESMWEFDFCKRCGFPLADVRTQQQIKDDDIEMEEMYGER